MSDQVRSVTMEFKARAAGDLGAPMRQVAVAAEGAAKSVEKMDNDLRARMTGAATDVRKLDRGMTQLSHGVSGLSMNLFMAGNMMAGAGGQAGKMAEHMQKGATAVMLLHSGFLAFRGTIAIMTTAGSAMIGYATAAMTAAQANNELALSHGKVALAATTQMAAQGAGGFSRAALGGLALQGGLTVGGGLAGAYAAKSMGYGPNGMLAGAAAGGLAGYAAPGAIGWGAGKLAGAFAGVGLGTGSILAGGALGLANIASGGAVLNKVPRGFWDTISGWVPGLSGRTGDKALSLAQERRRSAEEFYVHQTAQFGDRYGFEGPAQARQRELGIGLAGLQSQYGSALGQAGLVRGRAAAEQGRLGAIFTTPGSLRDLPGAAAHERALQEQLRGVSLSGAGASVQAGINVNLADQERARALDEVAQKEKQIAAFRVQNVRTGAEEAALDAQLATAKQRLLEAEEKRLVALKEQAKVTAENAQQVANVARAEAAYYQAQVDADKELRRNQQIGFARRSPAEQERLAQISRNITMAEQGRGGQANPEMAFVNGRWQQIGSGVGGLSREDEQLARSSGLFDKRLDDLALKQMSPRARENFEAIRGAGQDIQARAQAKQAEALTQIAVTMEQKIAVEIDLNAQSVADQITQAVVPVVAKMIKEQAESASKQVQDAARLKRANDAAKTSG